MIGSQACGSAGGARAEVGCEGRGVFFFSTSGDGGAVKNFKQSAA